MYNLNNVSLPSVVDQLVWEAYPEILGESAEEFWNNHETEIMQFSKEKMYEAYDTEWSKSEIVIRTTNWRDLSDVGKEGVVIHEIGHALKLDHPDKNVLSVMQSGVGGEYHSNYITVYDIYSLKSKWGI